MKPCREGSAQHLADEKGCCLKRTILSVFFRVIPPQMRPLGYPLRYMLSGAETPSRPRPLASTWRVAWIRFRRALRSTLSSTRN